jgi:hypothetical protein
VQEIVCEIVLDQIALVTTTDNEIMNAVMRVKLHDVPKDWFSTNLHHGFGPGGRFLTESSAQPACENDDLQLN